MKTKLHELLEFPCDFTFKVIGLADKALSDRVVKVVQSFIPGEYTPTVKPSEKGNYYSISITIQANDAEQIEALYLALNDIKNVRMVL